MTIQEVCRKTGLAPDLLRAWERRYRAVRPARRPNNHRRYSGEDLQRLLLLRDAVNAGHAISQIAALADAEIRALLPETAQRDDDALLSALIMSVRDYDAEAVERVLLETAQTRSAVDFCDSIVTPLLHEVGEYWLHDASLIAKEHLVSSAVAGVLERTIKQSPMRKRKPMIFATIPYERHVIGAAMAAAVGAQHGYRALILGAGSTPAEIADVAKRLDAAGVGVSVIYQQAEHTLHELAAQLAGIPLWVGGAKATGGPWKRIGTMHEFAAALNAL